MGIAIVALCISLPRTVDSNNPISLDYQGTIIAIFSLLVTALIGWQIYSSLNIEKRVRIAELQLERAKSNLRAEHKRIERIGNITLNYSEANHCLILSIMQYYEVLRREHSIEAKEAARHLCNNYIISAKAMALYLKINNDTSQDDDNLLNSARSCVQSLELSAALLFNQGRFTDVLKDTFGEVEHKLCDDYYVEIMHYAEFVGKKHLDMLNKWRQKRISLISPPTDNGP